MLYCVLNPLPFIYAINPLPLSVMCVVVNDPTHSLRYNAEIAQRYYKDFWVALNEA